MDGMNKIIRAFKSLKWYEVLMCLIMLAIAVYYAIFASRWNASVVGDY